MPTNSFPKSSSAQIIGNTGLDLGRASGNVRAVSPHWTPLRVPTSVTTLFPTLSHDREMLSQSNWTDELHSVAQQEKTQQAPAECLPRNCTLARGHLPAWRVFTRYSPATHVAMFTTVRMLLGSLPRKSHTALFLKAHRKNSSQDLVARQALLLLRI